MGTDVRRAMVATLALITAALSGCTESQDTSTPGPAAAKPAEINEDTGGVEGFVVDDQQTGIVGAEVGILDLKLISTTDSDGRFSFSTVPPGEYVLLANRLGYEPASQKVSVVLGEVTSVDIVMTPLAVAEPYAVLLQEAGLFGCGSSWRPAIPVPDFGNLSGIAACGAIELVAGPNAYDRFILFWDLNGTDEAWQSNVFEMVWDSTQVAGKGLSFVWEKNGCSGDDEATFAEEGGESPLRVYEEVAHLKEVADSGACGGECTSKKCTLQSRVFSEPGTLGATAPADVGVTAQQPFVQYWSAFFHDPAPLDFTAVPPS